MPLLFAFLIYAIAFALIYSGWARSAMRRHPIFEDSIQMLAAAGACFGVLIGVAAVVEALGLNLDGGGVPAMVTLGLLFLFGIFTAMGLLAGAVLGVDALIRHARLRRAPPPADPFARREERP